MATVINVEQREPEWFAARLGRVTGSRVADVFAAIKSGEAAARKNYRIELALEQVTGVSQERSFTTQPMQDGIDREPEARALYEAAGSLVDTVGFYQHDALMAGYSPDGIVGYDGLVEIKCPEPAAHLDVLLSSAPPVKYQHQMRHGLWVTGRAWCDFVSYHPAFPEPLRLVVRRFTATPEELAAHGAGVKAFCEEVTALAQQIRGLEA